MNADLADVIDLLIDGREAEGKQMVRTLIRKGLKYEGIEKATGIRKQSISRMLSPKGNPTSRNLFLILRNL